MSHPEERARYAHELAALAPLLEAEIHHLQTQIVARALALQRSGELTGERALGLWAEYLTAEGLRRQFSSKLSALRVHAGKS